MSDTHEVIYLIDMGEDIVWCEEPAPHNNMDEDDAIKYIRADLYDAQAKRIAELEEENEGWRQAHIARNNLDSKRGTE